MMQKVVYSAVLRTGVILGVFAVTCGISYVVDAAPKRPIRPAASQNANDLFAKGFEALRRGNNAEAEALFRRGLRTQPKNITAQFYLAEVLHADGRNDEAAGYYRAVASTGGEHADEAAAKLKAIADRANPTVEADQYYEQYRTNGFVTASCEDLLSFAAKIQRMMIGSWSTEGDQSYQDDGEKTTRRQEMQIVQGPLAPIYIPQWKTERYECRGCCHASQHYRASVDIRDRDSFGALRGSVSYNLGSAYYSPASLDCPEDLPAESGTDDMTIKVPIEQFGESCKMQMPIMTVLSKQETADYSLRIVSTDAFVRVRSDKSERTYRRVSN